MTVRTWRDEFPAIAEAGRIPLNNCSASPIPSRGLDARAECERIWVEAGNPWGRWLETVQEAKARFAALINADPAEVAVVSSATDGLARFANALSYDDRSEVVLSDLEFPSVPQFWHAQRARGAVPVQATSPDGITVPASAYEGAISPETLLVCSAHAYSFTGGLMDVSRVADAVHEQGGYLFLDAYQTLGVVPIDVDAQGIDALVSGTLKFLLGGPGIAFLYVDSALARSLEPTSMGWFGVDDPFAFETEEPRFADGARRFELGTPPATVAYQANAGMELIQEVGVARIRSRTVELTDRLVDGALERGFAVRTPREADARGAVVNVQVRRPGAAVEALLERGINVSERGGGVRLSPHFFNTAEDVETALDAIEAVATPTR